MVLLFCYYISYCFIEDLLSIKMIFLHSHYCRLSPVGVYLWNHLTRGCPGVCLCPQNCMNTEDGGENLQILNTDSSPGELDILRSVLQISFVHLLNFALWSLNFRPQGLIGLWKSRRLLILCFMSWLKRTLWGSIFFHQFCFLSFW